MNSIKEIKSAIYKTDCKNYIMEGLWVSDPVVTLDGNKIVDNYFVYSRNANGSLVAGPYVIFGIYTKDNKSAYITRNDNASEIKAISNEITGGSNLYEQYDQDFLELRKWAMTDIDAAKKTVLNRYLENLEKLGGTGIMEIYRKTFPAFFQWADANK